MTTMERTTWCLRSELQLLTDQLGGLAAWHAALAYEDSAGGAALTREMHLDLARRVHARSRERRALEERAAEQLEQSARVREAHVRPRAILVHRDGWLRGRVALALQEHGIWVVGSFEDGADGAGALVVEQPEILFVEDRLPTLTGLQVLERARDFAPASVTGVQLVDVTEAPRYRAAGAAAAFSRRLRPAEIADELVGALARPRVPMQVA